MCVPSDGCFTDYDLLKTARGEDVRKWYILTPLLDNEGEGILIHDYTASWPLCDVWVLVEGQSAAVAAEFDSVQQ